MIDMPSLIGGIFIGIFIGANAGAVVMAHAQAVKKCDEDEKMRRTARGRFKSWRDFNTQGE